MTINRQTKLAPAGAKRVERLPASFMPLRIGPLEPSDPCFGCVDWFMYARKGSQPERTPQAGERTRGDLHRS